MANQQKWMAVLFHRRITLLAAFGFASGLPYFLTSTTLQAWMKDRGVDLATIGLFALITLPYTLKFLWSPLLDRYTPPLLGRRRGWLALAQFALVAAIAGMGLSGASPSLQAFAIASLLVATLSATQDIVADAYRADALPAAERGLGAAAFVMGYRVALIAIGSGALVAVGKGWMSWPAVYLTSAGVMSLGVLATLVAPEPPRGHDLPDSLLNSFVHPLRQFLLRPAGWLVLLFVVLFKIPDVVAAGMTLPFMMELGIDKAEIGVIRQGLGMGVTIVGAFAGGWAVAKLGLFRSLWLFAVLQAVSNLGFVAMAHLERAPWVTATVISIESFCGGLVTAGFIAFLMSQCDPRHSATQYALLTSVMALTATLGGAISGYLAQHLGWVPFFWATVALAGPGMLLLAFLPRVAQPQEEQAFDAIAQPARA